MIFYSLVVGDRRQKVDTPAYRPLLKRMSYWDPVCLFPVRQVEQDKAEGRGVKKVI